MKNLAHILIATLIILALVGCAKKTEEAPTASSETMDSNVSTEATSDKPEEAPTDKAGELSFSTVDIDGNPVTDEIIKDSKVVMLNFWEPWCGPCVGEMPDIEKLYEEYKDKGFLVIGVFSTAEMEDDAKEILKECGTTYPVIHAEANLSKYMTDYVPTTVFFDGDGNMLSKEPVIGANSYDDWKKMIESYLN